MEEEKKQGRAGELSDLDYVVRVDAGKVQDSWYEDVDLETLEARFVTIGAPEQDLPPVSGVLRLYSVEAAVFLAKSSLDGLCTARVRGEAKDVKILWLAPFAIGVEFTSHPPDKAGVLYPNIPERVDSDVCDVENLPITRHTGKESGRNETDARQKARLCTGTRRRVSRPQ